MNTLVSVPMISIKS